MAIDSNSTDSGSISRRTIIKGAAWSAPVMIAAVAVPAAVASDPVTSVLPVSASFVGPAVQTLSFTLSPAPAVGSTVTLGLSGSYAFAAGGTTGSATVGAGGVISVGIAATAAGAGTLSLSGSSSGVAWGPLTVQLSATAVNPTSSSTPTHTGSAAYQPYNFTLSPAQFVGTSVTAAITAGTGWSIQSATSPVAANSVVTFQIRRLGNASNTATIQLSGAGWGPLSVTVNK